MLNKNGKRELAYVLNVEEVKELPGYDSVHYVRVLGWWCVTHKSIKSGDKVIYFEIDSILPSDDKRFSFMEKRNYRVKTIKICKVVSQGLVLPFSLFPELLGCHVGDFVTTRLNVKLYEPESILEKNSFRRKILDEFENAKYIHKKFFNFPLVRILMHFQFFRILLKKIFISKKDKTSWPSWLKKTGQERIQNIPNLFSGERPILVVTEKVDGMSSSYWIDEKNNYFVGSHNVVLYSGKLYDPNETLSIKNNVWYEMFLKYNMKEVLIKIKDEYNLRTVAIQGEVYGNGIQKRTYSKKVNEHDLAVFHILFNGERVDMKTLVNICEKYNLPHVHIYDWNYELPSSIEEIIEEIDSRKSAIDGGMIEGYVFYTKDCRFSFKCVSPSYLLKYHN